MEIGGRPVTIGGIAKGVGMIEPHLATMFCFVATDAAVGARRAAAAPSAAAVDRSFNRVTVDGDQSTSDTVAILANGLAENAAARARAAAACGQFAPALEALTERLARMLVEDGEGATKLVDVRVRGRRTPPRRAERPRAAWPTRRWSRPRSTARDPNWGRIMMALGKSAARVDAGPGRHRLSARSRWSSAGVLREGVRLEPDPRDHGRARVRRSPSTSAWAGRGPHVDLRPHRGVRSDQREVHDANTITHAALRSVGGRTRRSAADAAGRRGGGKPNGRTAMAHLTMKELLEAGVHFGHQTKRWNPKMQKYIFGERNGIYIIDLQKTLKKFREALRLRARPGGRRAARPLRRARRSRRRRRCSRRPRRCGMFYVNQRWLGGTLTNFTTIRKSIARLKKLEEMSETGEFERLPKKEVLGLEREREKLEKSLVGIKKMDRLPSAVFIIDPRKEKIAVEEAQRLGDPDRRHRRHQLRSDRIDYPIPGNDDAIRAVRLITSRIGATPIARRSAGHAGAKRGGGGRGDGRGAGPATRRDRGRDADAGRTGAVAEAPTGHGRSWTRRDGEGAPRADRRRRDGLQGGAARPPASDLERAVEFLRKKGLADAPRSAHRDARDGVVGSYIHAGRQARRAGRGQLRDRLRRRAPTTSRSS